MQPDSEVALAWTEAFAATAAIKRSIRLCAEEGPEAMLESLGNYLDGIDAVEEVDVKIFDKAVACLKKYSRLGLAEVEQALSFGHDPFA
jgi:hypothetical protein